jgi:hypothetical protein
LSRSWWRRECTGQSTGVVAIDEECVHAVLGELAHSARTRRHRRNARAHRLEQCNSERLAARRKREQLRAGERVCQLQPV